MTGIPKSAVIQEIRSWVFFATINPKPWVLPPSGIVNKMGKYSP